MTMPDPRDVVESNAKNNEHHGQADPMPVYVYLAIVRILCLAVLKKRALGARSVSRCCCLESGRERTADAIQRLVLREDRVPETVTHS